MKYLNRVIWKFATVCIFAVSLMPFNSCQENDDIDLAKYLKKSYGPVIVGHQVDFSFSIASEDGSSLKNFEISATYPGSDGTMADTKCYWTLLDGKTYSKEMLTGINTSGKVTSGSVIDGIEWASGDASGYSSKAVTIRYTYVVPEEARGKNLNFRIDYTTVNGARKSYSTIDYKVENMDMIKDVVLKDLTDNSGYNYYSISELKAYSKAEVEAQNKSGAIDFVYRFSSTPVTSPGGNPISLGTCISAPSNQNYLSTSYVPASWTKNATLIESRKWDDMQLKGNTPNSYVTDMDIAGTKLNGNTFGEYGLKRDFSLIMQTADGKYRAFIYLKTISNNNITIGIKRLKIK